MKIFLDDERWPVLAHEFGYEPDISGWFNDSINGEPVLRFHGSDIIVCRTVESAMAVLCQYREDVTSIMFDNDLGTDFEGKDFAKQLIDWDLDEHEAGRKGLCDNLDFSVHSQNVSAASYIEGLMKQYLEKR